jgi:hypothetical protein
MATMIETQTPSVENNSQNTQDLFIKTVEEMNRVTGELVKKFGCDAEIATEALVALGSKNIDAILKGKKQSVTTEQDLIKYLANKSKPPAPQFFFSKLSAVFKK